MKIKHLFSLALALCAALLMVAPALAVDEVIWATGTVTLDSDLLDDIATLLETTPPEDAETLVYAVTHVSGSEGGWNVSLVNLDDTVVAPYETWSYDNVVWAWFMECTGTDPDYSCDYYTLPVGGGGGEGGLILPWRSGYNAQYGSSGVHGAGSIALPGSYAVDFVGSDAVSESMPPYVVAAASGTVTQVCDDGISLFAIVSGGPVDLGYFHFVSGTDLNEGDTVTQGEVLGQLKYGTFTSDQSPCNAGWGSQGVNQYHLHFVFYPTTGDFLEIGGCVLDLVSANFVCNGNTYAPLTYIPNGGQSSDNDSEPLPSTGGAHLWDGPVQAFVEINQTSIAPLLPDQDPLIPFLVDKVMLIIEAVASIFLLIYVTGFTGIYLLWLAWTWINAELIIIETKVGMFFLKLIF